MASLVVLLIILGCAAYQYFKGTFVKSFATLILVICAAIVAFNYFETAANFFISRGNDSRYTNVIPWSQTLCFVLLFIVAFAVFQAVYAQLAKYPIKLGVLPDSIGRAFVGVFLGLILSGVLITAMAMAPLSNKYPYQRFSENNPDTENPSKVLLNVDGFATGWFSMVSSGSFSGKTSFAAVHPDFLNQVFLNRLKAADKVLSVTYTSPVIEVSRKGGASEAPDDLKDSADSQPVKSKSGHNINVVRVIMKRTSGTFTLAQVRLICKEKGKAANPTEGYGKAVYPIGYIKSAKLLERKPLDVKIDYKADESFDFAFYVPNDFVPVLVEFKQNNIAEVPPILPAGQTQPTDTTDASTKSD